MTWSPAWHYDSAHLVRDASPCRKPHRRLVVSLGRSVASRNGSRGTPTGVLERGIDLFTWSAQHRDMAGADTRRHVQCVCEQTRASSMKSQCAHSLGDFRRRQCLVRVAATHQRERNFGQPFLCALDLYSRAASSSRVDGASPARSRLAQVSVWVMTSTVLPYRLPEAIKELPADSVSLTASLTLRELRVQLSHHRWTSKPSAVEVHASGASYSSTGANVAWNSHTSLQGRLSLKEHETKTSLLL